MAEILRVSDAARIGLHAVLLLAQQSDKRLTTNEIAAVLGCSAAHLAKVLLQLQRAGLVKGKSGPKGGYQLAKPPERISLLDIYQAVEGRLSADVCPFAVPVCNSGGCPLSAFFLRFNQQVIDCLSSQRVSEITLNLGGKNDQKKKGNKNR